MIFSEKLINLIKNYDSFVITTHVYPDADGIGSQIALTHALNAMGKKVYCVNEKESLDRYDYLYKGLKCYGLNSFQKEYNNFDKKVLIIVDTNSTQRIGLKMKEFAMTFEKIIFIDHHPISDELKSLYSDEKFFHCVITSAAATGEIVADLISDLNIKLNKQIALALYTSILIDTSSFRYLNVTSKTHAIISKLLDTGINPSDAYNLIYGTKKIQHLQFLGKVLSTSGNTKDEKVAWISFSMNDIQNYNSDLEDTHGFINHLLVLDNIKVACMFREVEKNIIKVSLRTVHKHIDLSLIAQKLGGGGHSHSAACVIEGELENVINKTVKIVKENIE